MAAQPDTQGENRRKVRDIITRCTAVLKMNYDNYR